jgi:hypothetical protein
MYVCLCLTPDCCREPSWDILSHVWLSFTSPQFLFCSSITPVGIYMPVFFKFSSLVSHSSLSLNIYLACHLFDSKSMLPFHVVLIHSNNTCGTLLFTRNKRCLQFSTAFPHCHTLTFHDAAPVIPPVLHTCPVSLAGTVNAWKPTVPRDSHPTPMFMLSFDLGWG